VGIGLLAVVTLSGCREASNSRSRQVGKRFASGKIMGPTAFSHDGKRAIIFRSDPVTKDLVPSILDFAAKKENPITEGDFGAAVDWSPDDRYIAISRTSKVGIIDAKTLVWKPITAKSKTLPIISNFAIWSPDGRRIVFDGLAEDPMEIFFVYLYEVSIGKCIPQAVGNIRKSGNPFWQDRIIYSCLSGGEPPEYKYLRRRFYNSLPTKSGGKEPREILPDKFIEQMSAAPNSPHAAALCREDMANPAEYLNVEYALYLVRDPDAPIAKRLCSGKFVNGWKSLRWSSKGDELLLILRDDPADPKKKRVVIISTKTGEITKLTDREGKPIYGGSPQWVDGDKAICYSALNTAEEFGLWRYDRESKKTTQLYPFQH